MIVFQFMRQIIMVNGTTSDLLLELWLLSVVVVVRQNSVQRFGAWRSWRFFNETSYKEPMFKFKENFQTKY